MEDVVVAFAAAVGAIVVDVVANILETSKQKPPTYLPNHDYTRGLRKRFEKEYRWAELLK